MSFDVRHHVMFEPHRFVYHYTRGSTFKDKIFPSMTLQMGSFQKLNDPREARTWPFKLYSRSPAGNDLFTPALFAEATKNITQRTLVLCCSRDDPSVNKDSDDRPIRSGYGHPRMWAQYADRHQGVCLVLDQKLLHQSIASHFGSDDLFFGPVEYLNTVRGPSSQLPRGGYDLVYLEDYAEYGVGKVMEKHIQLFHRELFFTKHQDWRDEWEYRWVGRSADQTPVFVSIRDCLSAVILGHDCPEDMTEIIIQSCRPNKTPVHRANWQGWMLTILPDAVDAEFNTRPVIVLDGISFSTRVPCGGVFVQARDQYGNPHPLRIDNNGNVVTLGATGEP
jgi:Protein of unknown function (DUF2971)